jgi:hypothetical protein
VRFDNEARTIKQMGGKIIEITRPGIEKGEHVSENWNFKPDVATGNIELGNASDTTVARSAGGEAASGRDRSQSCLA